VKANDLERILSFYTEDASGLFNDIPIVARRVSLARLGS
jgi:hypothetical protein